MRNSFCAILSLWALAISMPLLLAQDPAATTDQQKAPAADETAPATEEKGPATEEKAPAAEEKAPAAEEKAPATEEKAPATEEKAEKAASAKPGPMKARFDQLLTEWKQIVGDLAVMQANYHTADKQAKAEIDKRWEETITKGEAMEPKLIEAAEKAYAEAPNVDDQLTNLLLDVVRGDVLPIEERRTPQTENYERALRIGKLLIENGCDRKWVYNPTGIAAFVMQDYDTAEKYLRLADKDPAIPFGGSSDVLDNLVRTFLAKPDEFKEAWKAEQEIRKREAEADDLPRVLLKTSKGDIELELFENEAPNTVANFISLVKKGFYDGLTFHRVLAGFMAQAGCPRGDGSGDPGYSIPCECYVENYRKHFRGSLSMAHAGRDTGGSQFFLTFAPTSFLDRRHTVFGRVIKGFDVLHKIQRRDPGEPGGPKPDIIIEATVLRDRGHEYVPKKVGQ